MAVRGDRGTYSGGLERWSGAQNRPVALERSLKYARSAVRWGVWWAGAVIFKSAGTRSSNVKLLLS